MSGVQVVGTVLSLWRYPVKSMLGEELNATIVTARGVLGDRAFTSRHAPLPLTELEQMIVLTATAAVTRAWNGGDRRRSSRRFGRMLRELCCQSRGNDALEARFGR